MAPAANQLSSSPYATYRKQLLALLKKLRATGSQSDLDLPRIAVIGNQSAGKSSVVEAISGITVPRDAGTCTRCPMECRMASSSKWSCKISIRVEYDESSGTAIKKVFEKPFGHVITDRKGVELALRRAQVAVLNPHTPFSQILEASAEDLADAPFKTETSLSFSRNTICIDLEGPEMTDLSFIDLPGIIQNAEPDAIQLVENMVVSHIKGNCLILVALPMTDDIENQKALRLARQEDPDGRRTIGVITKPDMLTEGATKSREIWMDIIEGRRHPLLHGYFCTRQPDDAQRERNITPDEARTAEKDFFSHPPWSNSPQKSHFGTVHLVSSLSNLLVGIISDTLPRIRSEAAGKLQGCNQELAALPKEIEGDPATYVLRLLTSFSDDVQRAVNSGLDDNQLIRHNRDTFKEFKSAIRKSAPNFVPAINGDKDRGKMPATLDKLAEGPPFYLSDMRKHIQRSITRELPNNVPFSAKVDLITKFQAGWESAANVCFSTVSNQVQLMLEQLVQRTFHRYEHLEGHVKIFVTEIVQKHFEACAAILVPVLMTELQPFTQNTHYLEETSAGWSSKYKAKRANKSLQDEEEPPHKKQRTEKDVQKPTEDAPIPGAPSLFGFPVSNPGLFSNAPAAVPNPFATFSPPASTSKAFPFGTAPVETPAPWAPAPPAPSFAPAQGNNNGEKDAQEREKYINDALAALVALGYHGISAEDFGKMIPPDEYETEIQVMAEVRGYFQIAYKRVIDNIPNLIDLLFVKAIANDMQASLITKFSLGTADAKERCATYLAENPMVVVRRKELNIRKERLDEVRQALQDFKLSTFEV